MAELMFAAEHGNVAVAESLVEAGAGVESRDEVGRTALHYASAGGHTRMVQAILAHCNHRPHCSTCRLKLTVCPLQLRRSS